MKLNKMREEMINSFIDCLKKDTIPWHRGWSSERPFNAVTNTEYHGANALWLTYNQQAQLYKDPRWCTFKQAQSKGWKIKQGSKGTKIEFWSLYDTEEKRKLTRTEAKQLTDELTAEEFTNRVKPVSNTYTVFNGEQIEGIPLYEIRKNVLHLDEFLYGRNKLIEKGEFGLEKEMSNEKSLTKEMEDYEDEHRRQLENLKRDKTPVVINGYGGPGAGKSTACMEITAALKKAGYGAEYVQEYAKELVYDKNMEMLDGSAKNQFEILKEQTRRVDRLYDQVDFIVTDSPILLNEIYNKELTPEYRDIVGKIQNSYSNFSFFIERDVSNFEEEGRIHNLAESIQKDQEIRDMLLDNDIKYKTYNHENINEIVNDAINYYESYNLMNDRKSEIIRDAEKISMTYSDAAMFRMAMKGQKSALEKFMNDEEIPQYIKNDSMAIGKEIEKYLDEGLGINDIIMKHIYDIDSSCSISNPAYTKKLMVELYSGTREEYEAMMILPDLSKDRTEFDDEQKVSETVENVKKCIDVKNEVTEMRVPEAEPDIIRDVQKFAFENGYEHIDKIINEGQGFWGKTEKIRNWLMNVVEVNSNEDVRNEARRYLTRLDMLQPKFESQIISEKINNDPLFSISSRDLMESRADSLREKEERIKDTQKKEKQKELKR